MNKPPRGIARFDSAAAMVLALSSSLRGEAFSSPSQSPWLDKLLPALNNLPRHLREWGYSIGGMGEAIGLRQARRLDLEGISEWITGQYPDRQYPAMFIGSSNGAMVHLAAALGIPWLPQTFLCPVRALRNDPDDAEGGMRRGMPVVDALLAAHPHIAVHHMQDPNQDRLMLHDMSYFRLKHRALPLAYREFMLHRLPAGATVYVTHCQRQWPVTRTGERSFFQFGATGGATEDEYHHGGPRVEEYLARYGIRRRQWQPPQPDEDAPEAEWGFDPALMEDIARLAEERRWRLVEIGFREPEALSFVTAATYRDWYRQAGIEPARLVVDSFLLMDPFTTLRLRALPFWLVFCTQPSADMLRRYLRYAPPFPDIDMMLFSHGTDSIGLASIDEWRQLLAYATRRGRFLGVDEARYPRDFATLVRYHRDLALLRPMEAPPPAMTTEFFEAALLRHGPANDVTSRTLREGPP